MTYKTKQEIFDTVMRHLFIQGRQSVSEESFYGGISLCRYRGELGSKCAVGILIPEEFYSPVIENKSVSSLMSLYPGIMEKSGLQPSHQTLLSHLQGMHDLYRPPISWESHLISEGLRIAIMHELVFNVEKYRFKEPKCPTPITTISKVTPDLQHGRDTIAAI